jgi:hypothetical protein
VRNHPPAHRSHRLWLLVGVAAVLAAPATAAGPTMKTVTVVVTDVSFDTNPDSSTWGRVTSNPPGIDCPGDCSEAFPAGSALELTAARTDGYRFARWDVFGNDVGTQCDKATLCSLTLGQDNQDVTIEAALYPEAELVALPEGAGTLTINPVESGRSDASCAVEVPVFDPLPTPCTPRYPNGTRVTITAVADPSVPGAHFVRWSDFRCGPGSSCTVTMNGDRNLSAFFTPVYLSVWAGSFGDVTVTPPGTKCALPNAEPGDILCQPLYPLDSYVTVERDPAAAQDPTHAWTGSCTGTGTKCRFQMRKNELVRAGTEPDFDIPTPAGMPVTLIYGGPRGGKISLTPKTGNPRGATTCRVTCTRQYSRNQRVVLRATGSRRVKFVRWADVGYPFGRRTMIIGNRSTVKAVFARRR